MSTWIGYTINDSLLEKAKSNLEDPLHMTLTFHSEENLVDKRFDQIAERMEAFWKLTGPFTGTLPLLERWGDSLVARVSVPIYIEQMRESFAQSCERAMLPMDRKYKWKPHITLQQQVSLHGKVLPDLYYRTVRFNGIVLHAGDSNYIIEGRSV